MVTLKHLSGVTECWGQLFLKHELKIASKRRVHVNALSVSSRLSYLVMVRDFQRKRMVLTSRDSEEAPRKRPRRLVLHHMVSSGALQGGFRRKCKGEGRRDARRSHLLGE